MGCGWLEGGLSSPGCSPGSVWLLLVDFLHPVPLLFVTCLSSVSPAEPALPVLFSSPWWTCWSSDHLNFCFLDAELPFHLAEMGSVGRGQAALGALRNPWVRSCELFF